MSLSQRPCQPPPYYKNSQTHFRKYLLFHWWQLDNLFLRCSSVTCVSQLVVTRGCTWQCLWTLPFSWFHTHLLITSSRHVVEQSCFAPVRAYQQARWLKCGTMGHRPTVRAFVAAITEKRKEHKTGWQQLQVPRQNIILIMPCILFRLSV